MSNSSLQWHPAFYAGVQIELCEEADQLIFENEHQLGTKPKEIDVLIIKKQSNHQIKKNIGKIFRKYNIIEYKSPTDYLSIDDFYQVYAYACFYKADAPILNYVPAREITITFVSEHYPRNLIKHLEKERLYHIRKIEHGIYYVEGDYFPIQIICTKQLTDKSNFWLHNLSNKINTKEQALKVMQHYEKHNNEKLYSSVVNVIINANNTTFKEVSGMCEALEKIYAEKYETKLAEKDSELAEKDSALAKKDAYIAELEKKLALLTA